jgi:hypothetical protein
MKRAIFWMALLVVLPASAQMTVDVQIGPPPPPEYIATTPPAYYQGRPCYFYDGYWHFRDQRGTWRYFREEPRFLAERRVREPPRHIYYERRRYIDQNDRRYERRPEERREGERRPDGDRRPEGERRH